MNDEDYKNEDILDSNYSEVYKYFYELGILNADLLKIVSCKFKEITGNLIDSAKTSDLGIDNLSALTQIDAGKAIDACDNAINKISPIRGNIGAFQNRLAHAISSLDNTSENLQNAESRIRDMDIPNFKFFNIILSK